VIHLRWQPGTCTVTAAAFRSRGYVGSRFTGGCGAIVTARACTDDLRVIDTNICPSRRHMAIVTCISTANMGRRLTLCLCSIVAADTCADYVGMVNAGNRRPTS
jgi:hypothetical protein